MDEEAKPPESRRPPKLPVIIGVLVGMIAMFCWRLFFLDLDAILAGDWASAVGSLIGSTCILGPFLGAIGGAIVREHFYKK